MTQVESTLAPGETIVAKAKLSLPALIAPLVLTIIGAVGLFFNLGPAINNLKPLALLLFIIGVVTLIPALLNFFTTQLVLTSERLVAEAGLIKRTALDLRLDKLDRIEVKKPLLGQLFGYGSLVVTARGVNRQAIPFISSPDKMRLKIREQRDIRAANNGVQ